ncbi:MAG: MFS transporter [Actinomycetota bacterium]
MTNEAGSVPTKSRRRRPPRSSLPEPGVRRWSALTLLSLALILAMSTWFSASAVIPQLRTEWELSSGAAAWLTIAVQLGFVAGALVSSVGNLSDLVSPRLIIFLGALGASAANAGLLLAESAAEAIAPRALTGFFLAGVYPPALKLMATWFQKGRGLALGILVGALTVGSALPHLVNGLGGLEWRVTVVATSSLTIAGGVVGWSVREGPWPFPSAVFDPRQAGQVLSNRGVRLASLGYFGHMWELYAMWAWFALFFAQAAARGGNPSSATAYATFAVIGIGGVGCVVGGVIGDRWGRARTTSLMMVLSGTCAVLIGLLFEAPTWLVLLIGLVWGFAVVADSAQFSTLVTELADQAYVGTALTLQLALGFTLTVATIWLIPVLVEAVSWRWAFAFLAPGPALGVLAMRRLAILQQDSLQQDT